MVRLPRSAAPHPARDGARRKTPHFSLRPKFDPRGDINGWLGAATPFEELTPDERGEIIDHMLRDGILITDGGRLSLGPRGEKLYGHQNFLELYAVFQTPDTFVVLHGAQEVGSVETRFLEQQAGEAITFTLGGHTWRVSTIDWRRGTVHVQPSE